MTARRHDLLAPPGSQTVPARLVAAIAAGVVLAVAPAALAAPPAAAAPGDVVHARSSDAVDHHAG